MVFDIEFNAHTGAPLQHHDCALTFNKRKTVRKWQILRVPTRGLD